MPFNLFDEFRVVIFSQISPPVRNFKIIFTLGEEGIFCIEHMGACA